MNYAQLAAFAVYVLSVFSAGCAVDAWIKRPAESRLNRAVHLGEVLLLGSIVVVGEMLLLSLLSLYQGWILWTAVFLNFGFLFLQSVRLEARSLLKVSAVRWDVPLTAFLLISAFFMFRNLYFLVDVDSHSTYLYAQKIWLEAGTSLVGNAGHDMRMFVPHANAVPYALGIALFGQETLFAQMVVAFWTVIVLLLIFGYTSCCFHRWYGLAAAMLFLFDEHIFYSGANVCCIINSALIAVLFASVYNFWEARRKKSPFHFFLGCVFLSQLLAHKYQMVIVTFFVFTLGLFIQRDPAQRIKEVCKNHSWIAVIGGAAAITFMWYLKNWIVTGCPTFPVLAGTFEAFNWTPDKQMAFLKGCGKISPLTLVKYFNYFLVWSGLMASKYLAVVLTALPVLLLAVFVREKADREPLEQWMYWLSIAVLAVAGICLTNYTDPRVYRYPAGVLVFAFIFSADYILRNIFFIRRGVILGMIMLALAAPKFKMGFEEAGTFKRPTFRQNTEVLLNRLHFDGVKEAYFPGNIIFERERDGHENKIRSSAWDTGQGGNNLFSAFLLPTLPQLDLWHSSIVRWDSYTDAGDIARDIKDFGIEHVMIHRDGHLYFMKVEEYAGKAAGYNRYPKTVFYDYGFPEELRTPRY